MAVAAATHLYIYGSSLEIIIPYIVIYVAAAAAARHCRMPLPHAAAMSMEKHLYTANSEYTK